MSVFMTACLSVACAHKDVLMCISVCVNVHKLSVCVQGFILCIFVCACKCVCKVDSVQCDTGQSLSKTNTELF